MTAVAWPVVAAAGLIGLAIGSFLNVVTYRVPRGLSVVSPGSACPRCATAIKGRHNVPVVSWLVLRGRCASCGEAISARYPSVEALTGAVFAAVVLRFGLSWQLPAYLYLAAVAVALGGIALDGQRLPDSIVLPSYIVSITLLLPAGAVHDNWHDATRALTGMGLLVAMLLTFSLAFPSGVGLSDVKLAGLLGFYLAWLSWDALLVGVVTTLVFAAGGGTVVAVTQRGGTRTGQQVPLALCLAAATVLSVLVAVPVAHWYGSLLTV